MLYVYLLAKVEEATKKKNKNKKRKTKEKKESKAMHSIGVRGKAAMKWSGGRGGGGV